MTLAWRTRISFTADAMKCASAARMRLFDSLIGTSVPSGWVDVVHSLIDAPEALVQGTKSGPREIPPALGAVDGHVRLSLSGLKTHAIAHSQSKHRSSR